MIIADRFLVRLIEHVKRERERKEKKEEENEESRTMPTPARVMVVSGFGKDGIVTCVCVSVCIK